MVQHLPSVIEQRELSWEVFHARSPSGNFTLDSLSLSQFYFRKNFSERFAPRVPKRWHAIRRRQPFVSLRTGQHVSPPPSALNAIRLESFLGEALEFAPKAAGLFVSRDAEWACAKHLTGPYSAMEAIFSMSNLHIGWIREHGGQFDPTIGVDRGKNRCEISPLVTYGGEDLGGVFSGQVLRLPYHCESKVEHSKLVAEQGPMKESSVLFIKPHGSIERMESSLFKAELAKVKGLRWIPGGLGGGFAETCPPNDSQELPSTPMSSRSQQEGGAPQEDLESESVQSPGRSPSSPASPRTAGLSARVPETASSLSSPHSPHSPHGAREDESSGSSSNDLTMQAMKLSRDDLDDYDLVMEQLRKEKKKLPRMPVRSNISCQDGNLQRHLRFNSSVDPGISLFSKDNGYRPSPGKVQPPAHLEQRLKEWGFEGNAAQKIWSPNFVQGKRLAQRAPPNLFVYQASQQAQDADHRGGAPGRTRHQWVRRPPAGREGKVNTRRGIAQIIDARDIKGQHIG